MNTDKQPETVYIPMDEESKIYISDHVSFITKNVYIFTPEELEALLQKERREAAEKAFQAGEKHGSDCAYNSIGNSSIDHPPAFIWLEENYPLPQPPKQ